ncbi:hypothetical protein M433DRAFT_6846 [Acidomyces richmondensis BFW]|nr:MAG: hypothetical protein FE78DRAFT_29631 [Acidomyces sp. 'richmondensis']KYG42805.1 hypothetical protein M433DRAFT_6846 [Acidomyces richmondensis BFW]
MQRIAIVATLAAGAFAQLTALPSCALGPAVSAVGSTGCSATNYTCICSDSKFIQQLEPAIESACNAQEVQQAESAAYTLCSSAGVTLTFPAAVATTTSSSVSVSTTSSVTETMSTSMSMTSETSTSMSSVSTMTTTNVTMTSTPTTSVVPYTGAAVAHATAILRDVVVAVVGAGLGYAVI